MEYFNKTFLSKHIGSILSFYDGNVKDPKGGFHQNYNDDGSVFALGDKHLVSSTRMVINYAIGWQLFAAEKYKSLALWGLDYVEQTHQLCNGAGYVWTIKDHQADDKTQQAYGYAFVLLMYSRCFEYGITNSNEGIYRLFNLLENTFWQAEYGLYADELTTQGELDEYRGQNANMHICEAMIAAYSATKDVQFLNRAKLIADNICNQLTQQTNGLIWEHYSKEFNPDWQYNKQDPKNLYRPWGFQPGHQTEWTKLLLSINHYEPDAWLVERAQFLFDEAYKAAWDHQHGGLVYGFDPDKNWCDDDKYFWVQAESFAAAALLHLVTDEGIYLDNYKSLWDYSWQNMVDHEYGAWFRVLKSDNQAYSTVKSEAGAKCDYHTIGACFDVIKHLP